MLPYSPYSHTPILYFGRGCCAATSAKEILICTPARVVVTGGELEIFGIVRRSSK